LNWPNLSTYQVGVLDDPGNPADGAALYPEVTGNAALPIRCPKLPPPTPENKELSPGPPIAQETGAYYYMTATGPMEASPSEIVLAEGHSQQLKGAPVIDVAIDPILFWPALNTIGFANQERNFAQVLLDVHLFYLVHARINIHWTSIRGVSSTGNPLGATVTSASQVGDDLKYWANKYPNSGPPLLYNSDLQTGSGDNGITPTTRLGNIDPIGCIMDNTASATEISHEFVHLFAQQVKHTDPSTQWWNVCMAGNYTVWCGLSDDVFNAGLTGEQIAAIRANVVSLGWGKAESR
jgi:hypothetical protein